jgi:GAF domain-containing protein
VAAAFGRLQSLLISMENVETFLQQLTELVAGLVEPPASCGITVRRDGQPLTVASSDDRAEALDESQYATSEGPCLHSMHTGQPVAILDMATERRWPAYIARAQQQGLLRSLSLPLTVQGSTLGAMNIYGFAGSAALDGHTRQQLEVFAGQASGALLLATTKADDTSLRTQLEQALSSRTVIDQALGIVMAEQRCDADQAFDLLRMRSQSSQRKLRDVAADLITHVTGQPPRDSKPFDTDH